MSDYKYYLILCNSGLKLLVKIVSIRMKIKLILNSNCWNYSVRVLSLLSTFAAITILHGSRRPVLHSILIVKGFFSVVRSPHIQVNLVDLILAVSNAF